MGAGARAQYRVFYEAFRSWAIRYVGRVPPDREALDRLLVDYLDEMLKAGSPASDGEKLLAAIRVHHPELSGKLSVMFPRAMRGLAGFRKARPARSRFPMPFMVTAANVVP